MTLYEMQDKVLSRLNEDADTAAGEYAFSTGGTPALTTREAVTQFLNEGAAEVCRKFYALTGTAVKTAYPIGQSSILVTALNAGEFTLWEPYVVTYNGQRLGFVNEWIAESWNRKDAPGPPKRWYKDGSGAIGLNPVPTASATLSVKGLLRPAPLVADDDEPDWIDEDIANVMVYYAALQVALKNADDAGLNKRAAACRAKWDEETADMWNKIPRNLKRFFPTPPALLAAAAGNG